MFLPTRFHRSAILVAVLAPALSAESFTVIPLPNVPIGNVEATSLNNNDQIAGIISASQLPFMATNASFTTLPLPAGAIAVGSDLSINDNGLIGGSILVHPTPGGGQGFIGSTVLPLPAGFDDAGFSSLNDAGQLAGEVFTSSNGFNAAIATASGTMVLSNPFSFFGAINAAGIATGEADGSAMTGTASGVTLLPIAAQFGFSRGIAINDSGLVCGAEEPAGGNGLTGFTFYYNGSTVITIPLPAGFTSALNGINSNCGITDGNQVVANAATANNSSIAAYIWDPANGTQLLSSFAPGWQFFDAVAVNSNGDILAIGDNGAYDDGYVLLQATPEPSTFLTCGSVFALCLYLRWRFRNTLGLGNH